MDDLYAHIRKYWPHKRGKKSEDGYEPTLPSESGHDAQVSDEDAAPQDSQLEGGGEITNAGGQYEGDMDDFEFARCLSVPSEIETKEKKMAPKKVNEEMKPDETMTTSGISFQPHMEKSTARQQRDLRIQELKHSS